MKYIQYVIVYIVVFCLVGSVDAATPHTPLIELEKKIAYQQGQFGSLYAQCGSPQDKAIIGGSLASWRIETFQGYNGDARERKDIEKSFDEAASMIANDASDCKDWIKRAAVTWHSIVRLSQYGQPTATAIDK
jgi:hypothetical protein